MLRILFADYLSTRVRKWKWSTLLWTESERRLTGIALALGTSSGEREINERNRSNKRNQQHQKTEGPIIVYFHIYCPLQVEISDDNKRQMLSKFNSDITHWGIPGERFRYFVFDFRIYKRKYSLNFDEFTAISCFLNRHSAVLEASLGIALW